MKTKNLFISSLVAAATMCAVSAFATDLELSTTSPTASVVTNTTYESVVVNENVNGKISITNNNIDLTVSTKVEIKNGALLEIQQKECDLISLSGLTGSGTLTLSKATPSGGGWGGMTNLGGDGSSFSGAINVWNGTSATAGGNFSQALVLSSENAAKGATINLGNKTSLVISNATNTTTIAGLNSQNAEAKVVSNAVNFDTNKPKPYNYQNPTQFTTNDGTVRTLTLAGDGNYSYAGMIGSSDNSSSLNITKTGAGTQTLSGTIYAEAITVSGGKLVLAGTNTNATITATSVSVNNAVLDVSSGAKTITGTFSTMNAVLLDLGTVNATTAAISAGGNVSIADTTIFNIKGYVENAKLISATGNDATLSITGANSETQTQTDAASALGIKNLYIDGYLANQRGTAMFSISDNTLTLSSYNAGEKYSLTWNGGDNGVWKVNGTGWTKNETNPAQQTETTEPETITFQNGDDVTFATISENTGTQSTVSNTPQIDGAMKVGTLTINGDTTFSKSTNASTAAISLASNTDLVLNANLTIGENVSLAVGKFESAQGQNNTVDYSKLKGAGTLTLGLRNDNGIGFNLTNFEGTIRVERGTEVTGNNRGRLQMNTSTFNTNAKIVVSATGDLVFNGSTTVSNSITFENGGNIFANSGASATISGTLDAKTGTLVKQGGGTLTLSGTSTIGTLNNATDKGTLNLDGTSTQTTILTGNAGTLNIGSGWKLTSLAANQIGGTVNIKDGASWEVIGNGGNASRITGTVNVNSGGTLTLGGHDALGYNDSALATSATIIAQGEQDKIAKIVVADVSGGNAASLTLSQKIQLKGNAELSATTGSRFNTLNGQVVATGTNNKISSNIELRKVFTVDVTNASDSLTISGVMSAHTDDCGGITKTGAGTLTLSGGNTYATVSGAGKATSKTTISAGTLIAASQNALGQSSVDVASGAKLQIQAGLNVNVGTTNSTTVALASGAKLVIDFANATAKTGVDSTTQKVFDIMTAAAFSVNGNTLSDGDVTSAMSGYYEFLNKGDMESWVASWSLSNNTLSLTMTVPEPSMFGVLASLGALALVGARRRRRTGK